MSSNLLSTMTSFMNEGLINKASALLGEPESGVGSALRMAGPTLLAGMMKKGTSPGGVSELFTMITKSTVDDNMGAGITQMLGDTGGMNQVLSTGKSLLSGVFGNRVDGVATAVSQASGVRPESALKALGFAAPMLFGLLKKQVTQRGLDAAGLTSMLSQERDAVLSSGIDRRITDALGIGNLRETANAFGGGAAKKVDAPVDDAKRYARQTYAVAQDTKRRTTWWPWAAGAALAVLGLVLLSNIWNRAPDSRTPAVATTDELPARVYFDGDGATIDANDRRTIAAAADSAQAAGTALTVTPVTPSGGDQQLAVRRAAMVREALISEGLANENVVVRPAETARSADSATEAQRVEIAMAPQGQQLR